MQLEQYISDLLYRYDCVTVPGFGSFLTQRQSAQVHKSTNTFYAPKKALSFNEQIKNSDGLLVRYIADAEKISFETASENLAIRVKSLKNTLDSGKTITFENIGDLVLNNDAKIEFNPSYKVNYLTNAFGLSQFVSPAVTRTIYKQEVEAIEKVAPIAITPERREYKSYLKYAAIAIVALGIAGIGFNNYVNNVGQHNQIAQEEANKQLESEIQEATFIINNPLPAITLNVNKQNANYHIVAGAFRMEANSMKKVEQLKGKGFNARKIGVNNFGLHQVAYGSYSNRQDATQALNKIRKDHNQDAWLLTKTLN